MKTPVSPNTCKTTAATYDIGYDGAARPQVNGRDGEQRGLIAPAEEAEGEKDDDAYEQTAHDHTEDKIEVEVEEAADLKVATSPVRPSAAEVEEHDITHIPYRSWCDACARGRGLGEQRGRHAGRVHEVPRVGIDYWYITSGSVKLRKELTDEFPMTDEGDAALHEARKGK